MVDDILLSGDPFFGHQGWIGSNPVENTECLGFTDLIQVGSVNKKFHIPNLDFLQI